MPPLNPFGKKEKQPTTEKKETPATTKPAQETLLEELCKGDQNLFTALSRTILLNPETTLQEGIEFHATKAQEYENAGNNTSARIAYQIAGEIALYEGKPQQMQKYFKKAAEIEPEYPHKKDFEYLSNKENAERAIAISREFHDRTSKRTQTPKEA